MNLRNFIIATLIVAPAFAAAQSTFEFQSSSASFAEAMGLPADTDIIGNFSAEYGYKKFVRGADSPAISRFVGAVTVARQDETIAIQITAQPFVKKGTPPTGGEEVASFLLDDGCLTSATVNGRMHTGTRTQEFMLTVPPLTTDLPYLWDGECLVSATDATTNSTTDGDIRSDVIVGDPIPWTSGFTAVPTSVTERMAATEKLIQMRSGVNITSIATGETFFVPLYELKVTRYIGDLAAGVSVRQYASEPLDGSTVDLSTIEGYQAAYMNPDAKFLQKFETFELRDIGALDAEGVAMLDANNPANAITPHPAVEAVAKLVR
jgi:hypothetical protein